MKRPSSHDRFMGQSWPRFSVKHAYGEWYPYLMRRLPPQRDAEIIAGIVEAQEQQLQSIPVSVRDHAVLALVGLLDPGEEDPTLFCEALQAYGPVLLRDPLILECLRILWVNAPIQEIPNPPDGGRRELLRAIGEALAFAPKKRGRKGFLTEERRAKIRPLKKSKSTALTRWVKKFDIHREKLKSDEHAVKQVLMEFRDKCRVKDLGVKEMVRKDLVQKLRQLSSPEIVDRVLRELRGQRGT